jgi:hypothetical protein
MLGYGTEISIRKGMFLSIGSIQWFSKKKFIILQKEIKNNLEKLSFPTINFFQTKSCKFYDAKILKKGKIGLIMLITFKSRLY